jgi:GH3 auxin-responsive promoter
MNLPVAIANSLWTATSLPALARFRRAIRNPAEVQRRRLRNILAQNTGSAYGQALGFDGIQSYQEFSRRVPPVDYESLEPWIDRIRRGEPRVLTQEPVTHLIPTSGSSGARKLIPFTAGLQREFNQAIGAWIADLYTRHPALISGPGYWAITPAVKLDADKTSAVPIGFDDDSAYLSGSKKRLVDAALAIPASMREVTDFETFRYLTLLCLVRRVDLKLISVWHPSFLALLLDALPGCWEQLLRDIDAGTSRGGKELPAGIRDGLRALPRRARQLSRLDPANPASIWPSLKVISCWGDGHAELAATDLQRRFPNTFIQRKGLLATEAFVSFPCSRSRPLAIASHFFEFIDDAGQFRLAHELAERQRYEIVVTTSGGLYRYRLGDLVEVTGFLNRTPTLRFLGRAGNVCDRRGEKLSEAFAAETLRVLLGSSAGRAQFAFLAPETGESSDGYTLFIEGHAEPALAGRLDALLKRNPNYAWCRELGQLQAPRIFRIQGGGYEKFAAREMARGKRLGDIKPCALSLATDWAEHFEGDYVTPANPIPAGRVATTDGSRGLQATVESTEIHASRSDA